MKIRDLFKLAFVATVASFTACENITDELIGNDCEIRLTSSINPVTRATNQNLQATQIVTGQQVGVTITGAKSEHNNVAWTAGESGALTNTGNPIYYGDSETTITAYHPFNDAWDENTAYTFSVSTDQSTDENYLNSDLLWATVNASRSVNPVSLTFTHKLAKINVTLTSTDITDLSGATISICGTNIATNFNPSTGELSSATSNVTEIKASVTTDTEKTASAIVIPQTIASGTQFIKVVLNNKIYYYTLNVDKELVSGKSYSYTLNVKNSVLINTSENITDWTNEDIDGDAEEEVVIAKNVTVETAGTLSTLISDEEKYNITSLTISGPLNGTDIAFLRDIMAGIDKIKGKITMLDLSNVSIVKGGSNYYPNNNYDSYTQDNIIGEAMFSDFRNLQIIKMPNNITKIAERAFNSCKNLTSITIPNSVTSIGDYTFGGCGNLTSITIPNSVTSIGNNAFFGCSSLTSIVVEKGNTVYDSRDNCNAIIETYTNTLKVCCNSTTIPNSVTSIGNNAFFGCSSLTSVTIPNSVTSIEESAFSSCRNLTSITIPNSVTSIGDYAFVSCVSLTSVTIPNSVTNIGDNAFMECTGLTSVTIPNSVTSIGTYAFCFCENLTEIHCKATTPPTINSFAFNNESSCTLYVPEGYKSVYETADYWKDFTNIVEE
ncbi:MAG: hypothetical protein E7085_04715 [Parabacteroides distasonis]|nr:hypothetical protein [Parabacteroides distasonis]